MEQTEIKRILDNLRAQNKNSTNILNDLGRLKRYVVDSSKFAIFLKHGGIRVVINIWTENYGQNIKDTALSIIGNCCTNKECSIEVAKCGGIKIFTDCLKKNPKDCVICRICRILANMAQFDHYASYIYKYGVVASVVSILNTSTSKEPTEPDLNDKKSEKISLGTQAMAIRLLRILWECFSNRPNMLQDGAVKAVSLVLTKHSEKWKNYQEPPSAKKERRKLLEDILKCLLLFSKYGTSECAQQVLADGNGFKSLVTLIEINPYISVKCLTNFSHVATSRADIANAEAVQCIVGKIKEFLAKNTNRIPTDIIFAFCLFCNHPMNCSEIKRAGGLPVILKVLKNCRSRRQEYQIVRSLSNFHYDEKSFEILISSGVVKIITDCLERNLKSKSPLEESHIFVKRKKSKKIKKTEQNINCNGKRPRENSPSDISNFVSKTPRIYSPTIYVSCAPITPPDSDCSSPSCTPPRNCELEYDDNSSNYSPVQSDAEIEDQNEENEIIEDIFDTTDQDTDPEMDSETDNEKVFDFQEKTVVWMMVILSTVARHCFSQKYTPFGFGLNSKKTLITLLKYLRDERHPNIQNSAPRILQKIVSKSENFEHLIESDMIEVFHSLTDMQHNSKCRICFRMNRVGQMLLAEIATLAQTDVWKDILYQLYQKWNGQKKLKLLLCIPIIVKAKPILQKFMDTWSGLNELLKNFVENPLIRPKIITALNKLALHINVNNPISKLAPKHISAFTDKYEFDSAGKEVVSIKLDDGSIVVTDKKLLIEKTEYFRALLTGSFRESKEEIIHLKNISNPALQFLLNLLNSDGNFKEPQILKINLMVLLEVIALTDVYLMENLTNWLLQCVEQFHLTVDTASDIYNWSVMSGTNFLRVETVAFLLTVNMKNCQRLALFNSIFDAGLTENLRDDISEIISRYLNIR